MLGLVLAQLPTPGLVLAQGACIGIIVPELNLTFSSAIIVPELHVKGNASRLLLHALINDIYVIYMFVCTHNTYLSMEPACELPTLCVTATV